MLILSRHAFLFNQKCKNVFLMPFSRFFHCHITYNSPTNVKSVQTLPYLQPQKYLPKRYQSTNKETKHDAKSTTIVGETTGGKLSQKARLKQAVRDYGATIIVFHVTISLASLGLCYVAVSTGVDAMSLLARFGFPDSIISNKVAVGGSTFVMAYAVHKVFAPVRIAVTLFSAPLLVRYLRKISFIKTPK